MWKLCGQCPCHGALSNRQCYHQNITTLLIIVPTTITKKHIISWSLLLISGNRHVAMQRTPAPKMSKLRGFACSAPRKSKCETECVAAVMPLKKPLYPVKRSNGAGHKLSFAQSRTTGFLSIEAKQKNAARITMRNKNPGRTIIKLTLD